MRYAFLMCALLAGGYGCENAFEKDTQGFLARRGDRFVRIAPNGTVTVGIDGAGQVSWGVAFWLKDGYISQSGSGGDAQVAVGRGGKLRYETTFMQKEEKLPVGLAQTVSAADDGAAISYEVTGADVCQRLSWCIGLDLKSLRGQRVWPQPGRAYRIPASLNVSTRRLTIEIGPRRGVELSFNAPHAVWSNPGGKEKAMLYVTFAPPPPQKADTVSASLSIRFVDIPNALPGEIRSMHEPLAIKGVKPNARKLRQFDKWEAVVDLQATYSNPFDPDEIALDAEIVSPSGRKIHLPGFHMVDFRRKVTGQHEVLEPGGESWRLRFTPTEAGRYTYRVKARDRSGMAETREESFTVVDGDGRGFVRTGKTDPRYIEFDNGESFFAIGHNLPTYHTSGQLPDEALRKMSAAGENHNRWWMYSRALGLEWEDKIGWYRQDEAWRLDHALGLAEKLGMYYMLCFDTHQDFLEKKSWDRWHLNPFNAELGGPCSGAADWLVNPAAKKAYKNRLRYIVARWCYSPHVFAWEFGNEFEGFPGEVDAKLAWHKEMSEHLKQLDPIGHPVTTSFWGKTGPAEFWELPAIDVVQTHCYTNNDENVAEQVAAYCLEQAERFNKPHIFGEFGIRSHATTADKDPEGWGLHNAFWAGTMSFSAGIPMPWWHESYIDPLDLYFHFTSIRNFVEGLPMSRARWRKLECEPIEFQDKKRPPKIVDLKLIPTAGWGKPEVNQFTIGRDGAVSDKSKLSSLLQGKGHADLKNPPTFLVDYPTAGRFLVHVGKVSRSGLLKIWIDDRLALDQELPCGEGLEKESRWVEEWKLWETTYDREFGIDVPAGKHSIRVDNDGADWVRVNYYLFTGCVTIDRPDVVLLGMQNDDMAVIWLQNRESTWMRHAAKEQIDPAPPSILMLKGLRDGPRDLEWWETWKGSIERTDRVEIRNGVLRVAVPEIKTDIALKIMPAK